MRVATRMGARVSLVSMGGSSPTPSWSRVSAHKEKDVNPEWKV